MFFVGFGKGTGTAWFADMRLEEVDPAEGAAEGHPQAALRGDRSAHAVRPVHRVPVRSRSRHVGGKAVRRQLRGPHARYKFAYLKREPTSAKSPGIPAGAATAPNTRLDRNSRSAARLPEDRRARRRPARSAWRRTASPSSKRQALRLRCYLRREGFRGAVTGPAAPRGQDAGLGRVLAGPGVEEAPHRLVPRPS